jgi:hypothetical protein
MKKAFLALAAGAAFAAVPASAQYANVNAGAGIQNRIAQLDARLQAGVQSGAITRVEAQSLRPQVRELRRLERQYSLNGLSPTERQDLQARIRTVRQQLRQADNNWGNRYTNWGDDDYAYGSGYGQQGYYGQQQGYYGQGGPYEPGYQQVSQVCGTRGSGLLGNLLGSILGGDRDNCVEVGERVTGNLGAVPYQYRDEFRDGGGVVHRSDGQHIYQIDARTGTVLRIYRPGY